MNWKVLWKGVRIAWTAAKVAGKVGLPMGKHVTEAVRIATAIEDAAKKERASAARREIQ